MFLYDKVAGVLAVFLGFKIQTTAIFRGSIFASSLKLEIVFVKFPKFQHLIER